MLLLLVKSIVTFYLDLILGKREKFENIPNTTPSTPPPKSHV